MRTNNTLLFCGDIMPGGVLAYQRKYISDEILAFMRSFDLRIGTLEAAIGTDIPYDEVKMRGRCNIIYARNEDFFRIKEMGINVVSLANNHVFDLGYDGFINTLRTLKENNIQYIGAGKDIEEAQKPAIININDKKVAIYAYCMYGTKFIGHVPIAGDNTFGVNPLDIENVVADIKDAKTKFDYVIIMPHWGEEYTMCPLDECRKMALRMVDAGADAVIGSHPHIVQPVIQHKGKTIAFSLGNFLFPDFYMIPPRPIWYPKSMNEVENIQHIVGYPYPIREPMLQVWNPDSRIGLILEFCVKKNKIKLNSKHFVRLTVKNILQPFDVNKKYQIKLQIFYLITKYNIFNKIYKLYTNLRKTLRKYENRNN